MCICEGGVAYAWGDSYKGQLGTLPIGTDWSHSNTQINTVPEPLVLPENTFVEKVVCGGIHSALLTTDGSLYTWGCGSDGRIGHPEYEGYVYLYKESRPKRVEAFSQGGGSARVVDVASAYYHMACLVA